MNTEKAFSRSKKAIVMLCILLVLVAPVVLVFSLQSGSTVACVSAQASGTFVSRSASTDLTGNHFRVTSTPAITVLTHGLGGDASHWSNDGIEKGGSDNAYFAFDERSLIERLRQQNWANVFWARMDSSTSFSLYRLPIQGQLTAYEHVVYAGDGTWQYIPNPNLPVITNLTLADLNQHMVIVFESTQGRYGAANASHQTKYNEFRTMLHAVVREFGYLTGGTYPRINLIGHSRGRLTNMEFANAYPHLICSMFALGTPFFGSNFGRVNFFSNMVIGDHNNPALLDINDELLQHRLQNDWAANRANGRSSHINFYPMSGYSSVGMIADTAGGAAGNIFSSILNLPPLTFPLLVTQVSTHIWAAEALMGITQTPWTVINNAFYRAFSGWAFLWVGRATSVLDDLLVHRDSQEAIGYTGITETFRKRFVTNSIWTGGVDDTNFDASRTSTPDFAIVHNLQTRDECFINWIMTRINTDFRVFTTNHIGDMVTRINIELGSELTIPETIHGRTVTAIGPSAFIAQTNLTQITLPPTITSIHNDAFYHIPNLQAIEVDAGNRNFVSSSGILYRNRGQTLTFFHVPPRVSGSIVIPEGVDFIETRTFYDRHLISSIYIPQSVQQIMMGAFALTTGLENITVNQSNNNFFVQNGVLYRANGRFVHLPDLFTREVSLYTQINIYNSYLNTNRFRFVAPQTGHFRFTLALDEWYSYNPEEMVVFLQAGQSHEFQLQYIGNNINSTNASFLIARNFEGNHVIHIENRGGVERVVTGFTPLSNFDGNIVIPWHATRIERGAFRNTNNIRSATIEGGGSHQITIEAYAFANSSIEQVFLPANVSLRENVFLGSTNVTIYAESLRQPGGWFSDWNPDNRPVLWGFFNFFGMHFYTSNDGLVLFRYVGDSETLEIPASFWVAPASFTQVFNASGIGGREVVAIGSGAFRGNTNLQSVTIPDTVWRIEGGAFEGTTNLASIQLPNSVEYIGSRAFYRSGITEVTFPQNTHFEVHNWAFARTRLTSVTIPANAHFYCGVFENITTLTSVHFEQGVARTAHRMFWGATNLTEVTLPDTLTYLNSYTFRYTALTSIVIPASVHTIGTGAFFGAGELSEVVFETTQELRYIRDCAFRGTGVESDFEFNFSITRGYRELKISWNAESPNFLGICFQVFLISNDGEYKEAEFAFDSSFSEFCLFAIGLIESVSFRIARIEIESFTSLRNGFAEILIGTTHDILDGIGMQVLEEGIGLAYIDGVQDFFEGWPGHQIAQVQQQFSDEFSIHLNANNGIQFRAGALIRWFYFSSNKYVVFRNVERNVWYRVSVRDLLWDSPEGMFYWVMDLDRQLFCLVDFSLEYGTGEFDISLVYAAYGNYEFPYVSSQFAVTTFIRILIS